MLKKRKRKSGIDDKKQEDNDESYEAKEEQNRGRPPKNTKVLRKQKCKGDAKHK